MKLLAHKSADFESPIVTVHEALRLRRQSPEEWEGRPFFDIIQLSIRLFGNKGTRLSCLCKPPGVRI
jgi:hypothetical protein